MSVDRVRVPGVELAIQEGSNPVRECIRKPPSDERWVSDDGDTNHFTRYSSNLYDLVMILPGKERVLIGDGKAMRETGVGSLNFKMHSKTDFNVTLTGVYVAEGIGFNHSSFHQAQARKNHYYGQRWCARFQQLPDLPSRLDRVIFVCNQNGPNPHYRTYCCACLVW